MDEPKASKKFRVSAKNREYFTTNLAALLKATVPVSDALRSLADTAQSRRMKAALSQIQEDIDEGFPFWEALERSGVVSRQTLALILLGEKSGTLVQNLEVAAAQEEKQRIFRAKLHSALIYPGFVLSLTLVVGVGLAWLLLPRLADTFGSLEAELPFMSKMLIDFGSFLRSSGRYAVPVFLLGLVTAVYVVFFGPKTKVAGRILLFRTPGISHLMKEVEIARFGYLLGTLLQAGLPITDALSSLEKATIVPPYQKLYQHLRRGFENGDSFQKSLGQYRPANRLIPPTVQQMIVAGEKSGSLPDMLLKIGRTYEGKASITAASLATVLEPLLLIIVWLSVIAVAIAVILPIYRLAGGLDGF